MNEVIAKHLKAGIYSELDNLIYQPKAIIMSSDLHEALGKPSEIYGVSVLVDDLAEHHWRLKF